jgi:hypothetical protein
MDIQPAGQAFEMLGFSSRTASLCSAQLPLLEIQFVQYL